MNRTPEPTPAPALPERWTLVHGEVPGGPAFRWCLDHSGRRCRLSVMPAEDGWTALCEVEDQRRPSELGTEPTREQAIACLDGWADGV